MYFWFLLKCWAAAEIIFYSELISDLLSKVESGANAHTTLISYRSLKKHGRRTVRTLQRRLAVVMGTTVLFTALNLWNLFIKMIRSKDLFTELFSALQLPELISSQTICHSVNNSALRFTFTYWGTVRSGTIVHNHSREMQCCSEWYTRTKIITRWKCPLCTVKSLNMMLHGC